MKSFEPLALVAVATLATSAVTADEEGPPDEAPTPNPALADSFGQTGLQDLKYVVVLETEDGEIVYRYTPERELKTEDLSTIDSIDSENPVSLTKPAGTAEPEMRSGLQSQLDLLADTVETE